MSRSLLSESWTPPQGNGKHGKRWEKYLTDQSDVEEGEASGAPVRLSISNQRSHMCLYFFCEVFYILSKYFIEWR
jgi:hypothetical protein